MIRTNAFISAVLMPVILRSDISAHAGAAAAAFSSSSSLLPTTTSGATHSTSTDTVGPHHSSSYAAHTKTPNCGSSLVPRHRGDRTACQASSAQYHEGKITVTRQPRPRPTFSSTVSSLFGSTNGGSSKKKKKKRRTDDARSNPNDTELVELDIYYRIYNPDSLQSGDKMPLMVLHGGPSLPSEYLYSIADNMPGDRAVIFYDQIGCGRSSEPKQLDFYGIHQSIDDLEVLLDKLGLHRFHLLGHSFGGVLAYEYAKRIAERGHVLVDTAAATPATERAQCVSVILANTSTSMEKSDQEWTRLVLECATDNSLPGVTPNDRFFRRNQCRLDEMPEDLSAAFEHCGRTWFGTSVVADWVAAPPSEQHMQNLPPFLIIAGEYDFVTLPCTAGWTDVLGDALVKEEMMTDCSHYVHYEQPASFGSIWEEFCSSNDDSSS